MVFRSIDVFTSKRYLRQYFTRHPVCAMCNSTLLLLLQEIAGTRNQDDHKFKQATARSGDKKAPVPQIKRVRQRVQDSFVSIGFLCNHKRVSYVHVLFRFQCIHLSTDWSKQTGYVRD